MRDGGRAQGLPGLGRVHLRDLVAACGRLTALAGLLLALAVAPATRAAEGEGVYNRLLRLGDVPTPALALRDLEGRPVSLLALRDQVVLVNFWATWCGPCVVEMPAMKALAAHFAGRPFTILGVNYGEGAGRVEAFRQRTGLDFRMALDPDKAAAAGWGVRILPTSFLVGPDGRVRYAAIGAIDWTAPEAVAAVEALLPKPKQ